MKAVYLKQFGGAENFELREVEPAPLVEGGVRVRLRATAFNPVDYQIRRGDSESKLLKSPILGREMAGVVAEVDSSVKSLQVGDEVFSYVTNLGSSGTYAEEIVVPEALVVRKPANLTFNQSAAVPLVGLTAVQAVQRCPFEPDAKIFVAGGAGGVGSMILRLLKLQDARHVFSTAGNEESRNRLISMGLADERIFDYKDSRIAENLLTAAGGKFDVCFDTVGGKMSEISAEIIKIEGVYADITFLATEPARDALFGKGVTIRNISNYSHALDGVTEKLNVYRENLDFLREKLESGELPPSPIEVVGGLSAETVAKAHEMLEKNLTRGKKLVMEIA
ncbi:MAG TPA: NADP-dependent oxidoreductase [Pyrinomonadaceae bacterium]|jgi:NADPH:quinone reductase-like Zn-dependent oxidoreductase